MAILTFTEMYTKMTSNGGFKPGELMILTSGRQSGKSRVSQDMTQYWAWPVVKFERVNDDDVPKGEVLCDANQDIQDWLMREFEPSVMWKYANKFITSKHNVVAQGCERVLMRDDVYTALVLRWS